MRMCCWCRCAPAVEYLSTIITIIIIIIRCYIGVRVVAAILRHEPTENAFVYMLCIKQTM